MTCGVASQHLADGRRLVATQAAMARFISAKKLLEFSARSSVYGPASRGVMPSAFSIAAGS